MSPLLRRHIGSPVLSRILGVFRKNFQTLPKKSQTKFFYIRNQVNSKYGVRKKVQKQTQTKIEQKCFVKLEVFAVLKFFISEDSNWKTSIASKLNYTIFYFLRTKVNTFEVFIVWFQNGTYSPKE